MYKTMTLTEVVTNTESQGHAVSENQDQMEICIFPTLKITFDYWYNEVKIQNSPSRFLILY